MLRLQLVKGSLGGPLWCPSHAVNHHMDYLSRRENHLNHRVSTATSPTWKISHKLVAQCYVHRRLQVQCRGQLWYGSHKIKTRQRTWNTKDWYCSSLQSTLQPTLAPCICEACTWGHQTIETDMLVQYRNHIVHQLSNEKAQQQIILHVGRRSTPQLKHSW